MRATARLAGAVVLALALAALFATGAAASPGHHKQHRSHHPHHPTAHPPKPPRHSDAAVFVQTDNPAGNAVVAYEREPDGSLDEAGAYPTGGLGGILDGAEVDHLASQDALTYDRHAGLLYAVNAGSDTITVFAVRGGNLQRRQVLPSGGDFPVSVAVHGRSVYVLNARDGGSVQGYVRLGTKLRPVRFWHRDLGLDPEATPEFVSTPGQVAFSPDGDELLVTTKANNHSVYVYEIGRFGRLSKEPVVTELPGTVPFALVFDEKGHVVLTEAGAGAVVTFDLESDGTLTPIDEEVTGGAATCWVIRIGSRFYASNTGSNTLSGYEGDSAGELTPLGDIETTPGPIDAAASPDGRYLYVQTGAEGRVDGFRVESDGSLTPIGSVLVPGTVGGEGIAAS
jgi:DNA-binding beta-propeller fold protein YncE